MKTHSPASYGKSRAGCATAYPTTEFSSSSERLDLYLVRLGWAPSRRAARELIASGAVRVDGRPLRKGGAVVSGATIEVAEGSSGPATLIPNPEQALTILFADPSVLVVDKPALIPCHPLRPDEVATVMNGVVARYPETATAGPKRLEGGLVHRLDNGTSGALMVARTPESFVVLREALRNGRIRREYRALVAGRIEAPVEITTPIAHHRKSARKMITGAGLPGARAAATTIEPAGYYRTDDLTLLRVLPHSGSRHQIRVHLASIGHPLAGDSLYGGPPLASLAASRVWLHLAALEFDAPASGRVKLAAPIPADLRAALAALR